MTTDDDLLPLPEEEWNVRYGYHADAMREYARANVAHATAAKDAEIEALRVEVAAQRARADAMAGEAIKHEARAEPQPENTAAEALEYIFGKIPLISWRKVIDERLTPPWPLEHHARAMGLYDPPSAPVGVEGLMQLAREWCLSWGEWAHDADPGCAKESAAEAALRAALTQALARQPAVCPKCDGTGEADSGGIYPWGAPATIPCDCQHPAAVDGEDGK